MLPETVVYDVNLTLSLPPGLSAVSGINALAHAVEALYARDANPITSLVAEDGIAALAHSLPRIVGDPGDRDTRADTQYGAWLCGACLGAVGTALHHQRWFTLYEARTLEVLSSDDYRARLNNPAHWTVRNQPDFLNFARSACVTSASTGRGVGGALATTRLNLEVGGLTGFKARSEKLARRIAALDGVVGAHLGAAAEGFGLMVNASPVGMEEGDSVAINPAWQAKPWPGTWWCIRPARHGSRQRRSAAGTSSLGR